MNQGSLSYPNIYFQAQVWTLECSKPEKTLRNSSSSPYFLFLLLSFPLENESFNLESDIKWLDIKTDAIF